MINQMEIKIIKKKLNQMKSFSYFQHLIVHCWY